MILDGRVLGLPLVAYNDTKTNVEALTGVEVGSMAYATDTDKVGVYDGAAWSWVETVTGLGGYEGVYVVAKSGSLYSTFLAALAAASGEDRCLILAMPGQYYEDIEFDITNSTLLSFGAGPAQVRGDDAQVGPMVDFTGSGGIADTVLYRYLDSGSGEYTGIDGSYGTFVHLYDIALTLGGGTTGRDIVGIKIAGDGTRPSKMTQCRIKMENEGSGAAVELYGGEIIISDCAIIGDIITDTATDLYLRDSHVTGDVTGASGATLYMELGSYVTGTISGWDDVIYRPASIASSRFTDLSDTPSVYTGDAGKYVVVNATEDGVEFGTGGTDAHNDLTGIQGGDTDEYYHLDATDYAALTDADAQLTALHTDGIPTFASVYIEDYGVIGTEGEALITFSSTGILFNESNGNYWVCMRGDTDDNLFFLDPVENRIGIGIDSPIVKFDVAGNIRGDNIYVPNNGSVGIISSTQIDFDADGIEVNGDVSADNIYVPASGTVGIDSGALITFGATEVVVNEAGGDYDLRVEGDTLTHLWFVDGGNELVFINESSNAFMTTGLTIQQGAADDEILAFKSSDIGHGMTSLAETDTYGLFRKTYPGEGGLEIRGFTERGDLGASITGIVAASVNTTKTNDGRGMVTVWGLQKSGTSIGNTTSNGNVFAVVTKRSTGYDAVVIIDEDGDIHYDGSLVSYDEHDDALAAWDLSHVLAGRYNEIIEYGADKLERMGVIVRNPDGRSFMVSNKRMQALQLGALGQLYKRIEKLERQLEAKQ